MLLFDILASILGKAKELSESEVGQAYQASGEMDRTIKEMEEMNKSLYDED